VKGQRTGRHGSPAARKRLGEILVEAGVIDEHQLQVVLSHQRRWGGKLGQCVLGLKLATEAQIVQALASKLDCAIIDLRALEPSPALEAALRLVPGDLALRHKLLPIALEKGSLTVAMADPADLFVIDELAFRAGRRVNIVLAGEHEIVQAVRRLYFLEPAQRPEAIELEAQALPPGGEPASLAQPGHRDGGRSAVDPGRALSPRQAAVLGALAGTGKGAGAFDFEPSRLAAAVARLLVVKGVISDVDLLAELGVGP
jgi:type IV pilus assembly protein PilB